MNGLALRISKGGGKKSRNSIGYSPLRIPNFTKKTFGDNILLEKFQKSSNADEQLSILKQVLDGNKDGSNEETNIFLVFVFFNADAKHPVKCFLTRHVTKNPSLQGPFMTNLINLLSSSISHKETYRHYIELVSKISTCIENFPTGVAAVKELEVTLGEYFKRCLDCCVCALRDTNSLSPTEKNEVFNLAHLALRLLLFIIQKIGNDHVGDIILMFGDIRLIIKELVFDNDVPMDTKSVCGILYLSMHVLENGADSWIDVLEPNQNESLRTLLSHEASELALYSAIAIVVSVDRLQDQIIDGQPGILVLTLKILDYAERSSSESIFILGVTRTLVQLSKNLDSVKDSDVGVKLVDSLLVFIWAHLEHYMDSVRHLTAQALGYVVKYCTRLEREGNPTALASLYAALGSVPRSLRSYYVCVTSLAAQVGGRVALALPHVVQHCVAALSLQPVQASATTTLETLLEKHALCSNTEAIYKHWIEPIMSYVAANTLDSGVLSILENILAKAVRLDENVMSYILPQIKRYPSSAQDLKCILVLLRAARKSCARACALSPREGMWRGAVSYLLLEAAAVDAVEETRILSLSLIVESPKTTEVFTRGDLSCVLCYLKYNINAQSPNFRQLTLSLMKKFVKRLEDSYKVIKRSNKDRSEDDYYLTFLEQLRELCFDSLLPGANYSRRFVALQLLSWCERIHLEGYDRIWKREYVEKLLLHLEDSYENNKAFALEIFQKCPVELIKDNNYSISTRIDDILRQASSLKPTDCISAAYKLNLLQNKKPEYVLEAEENITSSEPVTYALLRRLHTALVVELCVCRRSIVSGAVEGPMYGLLHCMGHLVTRVDASAISSDENWTRLIADIINTCVEVNTCVGRVVNNSSPEGHLPMDMGIAVDDHGNTGGVRLRDGRQVTAQMVLLCAWRSVKEVSLLLGEISSRLTIAGEGLPSGTLQHAQMRQVGEHFTALLAETKHRGAFEQAYIGFTKLLARLWKCISPSLHSLPHTWLSELTAAIESGDRRGLCATRRSAGLPFMIQALVTTELQVHGNPKYFHQCMTTLLRLARPPASNTEQTETAIETRTHSINILRALFRNASLDESVATYVGDGLILALMGFEGGTWMERNSSTLLFSALMVRIFGVQRSKDTDNLCVRNRMTGRIFFLRYPRIYDFMLNKLKEVSSSQNTQLLRPSLYPVLLLLARLYPSSLEGTVSNLKLVAYIPHVLACAQSGVLKTRQLAAKAMVPLISPEQYIPHLEAMLALICDKNIKRNFCHGILLQLTRLLEAKPDSVTADQESNDRLVNIIRDTCWILEQAAGAIPCYLLADEYVKVINLIVWRFPTLIHEEMANKMLTYMKLLIFDSKNTKTNSGRDICLSNALYLYFILIQKYKSEDTYDVICKGLSHESYEVILSTLNYLLILHENLDTENKFEEHLSLTLDKHVLQALHDNKKYIKLLCNVLKNNTYLECTQKTLKVLTLERDTEKYIVETKLNYKNIQISDDIIINTLFACIDKEHENFTHVYLESLSNFVTKKLKDSSLSESTIMDIIRVIFACSSSDNNDNTRSVVVGFLEKNLEQLLKLKFDSMSDDDKFEYKATLYATLITVLEDDDTILRQRTSNTITNLHTNTQASNPEELASNPEELASNTEESASNPEELASNPDELDENLTNNCRSAHVISNKAGELLRDMVDKDSVAVPLFIVLALLDFRSEVCMTDDVNDECRVFDQNERYNIFLEETVWTNECANKILQIYNRPDGNVAEFVQDIIKNPIYRRTFEKLCNNNVYLFENMIQNGVISKNDAINPKIELFINRLCK